MATDVTRGQVGVVIYSPVIRSNCCLPMKKDVPGNAKQIQPMTRGLVSRGKSLCWSQPPVHPEMHWPCRDHQETQQSIPRLGLQELDLLFLYQELPFFNFLFTDFTQHYPSLILFQCQFPHPHCASIPPAWKPPRSGSTKPFPLIRRWLRTPGDDDRSAQVRAIELMAYNLGLAPFRGSSLIHAPQWPFQTFSACWLFAVYPVDWFSTYVFSVPWLSDLCRQHNLAPVLWFPVRFG